ncbi:MAG: branched-chain amino acid ABC transporter permease [Planctomycetota bacterium]|nr:branched-chain amino acid ABC transporter permease [Planctomycetota bacterium]
MSRLREWVKAFGPADWLLVAGGALVVVIGLLQALGVKALGLGFADVRVPFVAAIALTILLQAIFALGLNVVIGWTGLLDLGYASFIAVGAIVVSLGLVLTKQTPTPYPDMPVRQLVLTQAQRALDPAPGAEVVVRERPDLRFDVVQGAPAVLAALEAGDKTIAARHQGGLTLPVGQATARGEQVFGFPGGYFLLLVLAGLASAVMGLVRGFPTLRLTGDYYAIVTLGFAEIVWLITLNEEWLTGGAFGIKLAGQYRPTVLGAPLYSDTWQYYFIVVAALALVVVAARRLHASRVGRAWAAIKADETAARASGIDVDRAKMLAFAVSGFIGGVGGGLFAIKLGTVTAKQFDIWMSILVVCCLVLGGMGSIRGAVVGAAMLMGLGELLRLASDEGAVGRLAIPPEARFLVYGLILVLLMRFRPQGLLPPREEGPPPAPDELAAMRAAASPLYALPPTAPPQEGAAT